MPRPPQPEKRLELARQAVEVMQREGLDVPMKRLAEALGIKRPTLLYHFPTRVHIVERALEDLLTRQATFVLAKIAEHTHPVLRLDAQMRAVHAFHDGQEPRLMFLMQALAACSRERMDEVIDVGNRVFEAHRRAAVARLREGIEAGTVAPHDPEALVVLVRATIDGLMVQRVMTGVALAPAQDLFFERTLRPLIRAPEDT